MPRNPQSTFSQTRVDYSGEPTVWTIYGRAYNIVTNADYLDVDLVALKDAVDDIVLTNRIHEDVTFFNTKFSKVLPTNPEAQREKKWFVRYQDNTNFAIYHIEIGGADASIGLLPGTDLLDLTGTEAAAFVTAFEGVALSPDGNAVTIIDVTFVGRST
jgi:hypothetical protein